MPKFKLISICVVLICVFGVCLLAQETNHELVRIVCKSGGLDIIQANSTFILYEENNVVESRLCNNSQPEFCSLFSDIEYKHWIESKDDENKQIYTLVGEDIGFSIFNDGAVTNLIVRISNDDMIKIYLRVAKSDGGKVTEQNVSNYCNHSSFNYMTRPNLK